MIGATIAKKHKETKAQLDKLIGEHKVTGVLMMLYDIARTKALHNKDDKDPLVLLNAQHWAHVAVILHKAATETIKHGK